MTVLSIVVLVTLVASALGANYCWFRMVRDINAAEPSAKERWKTFFLRSIFSIFHRHARVKPDSSLRGVAVVLMVATILCAFWFAALSN